MAKRLFILIVFSASYIAASAQSFSKEDSLWFRRVLDGDTTLKINEETMKAIREGSLIAPSWLGEPNGQNGILGIEKDIDGAGARDSAIRRGLNPYTMPPAVFAMYVLYMSKIDSINAGQTCLILSEQDKQKLEAMLPNGIGHFYYTEKTGFFGDLDFNHALSMIFSRQYRLLAHNRKHANAYKNYYGESSVSTLRFTEREQKQLREAVNMNIGKKQKNPWQKTNTIIDD